MKLSEIADVLDAAILTKQNDLNKEYTKVGGSDLMSDILAGLSEGGVLVTGLTTVQVVKTAIIAGISVVIYVRKKQAPQEIIDLAESEGIPLLSTSLSMFVTCGRLYAEGMTGLDSNR